MFQPLMTFVNACRKKKYDQALNLLTDDNVDEIDSHNNTGLHYLSKNKNACKSLIQQCCFLFPANIHMLNKKKRSPLFYACKYNTIPLTLLEFGETDDIKLLTRHDINGLSCFYYAIKHRRDDVALSLMKINPDVLTESLFCKLCTLDRQKLIIKLLEFRNENDVRDNTMMLFQCLLWGKTQVSSYLKHKIGCQFPAYDKKFFCDERFYNLALHEYDIIEPVSSF